MGGMRVRWMGAWVSGHAWNPSADQLIAATPLSSSSPPTKLCDSPPPPACPLPPETTPDATEPPAVSCALVRLNDALAPPQ